MNVKILIGEAGQKLGKKATVERSGDENARYDGTSICGKCTGGVETPMVIPNERSNELWLRPDSRVCYYLASVSMSIQSKCISVIVPHYNRPEMAAEAVRSILRQTAPPGEVLVVDDHSRPENSEKLHALCSGVTLVTTPKNLGIAGTRNFGAALAKGEWLAFLDDDDLYLPEKLERQISYLEAHPACQALGGALTMVTPDGRQQHRGGRETRQLRIADALLYTAAMAQSLLIRRDLFLELGGFNPALKYLEDYEFGIRMVASGREVHFLGEPMFIYHRGGRQQLSLQWEKMFSADRTILGMHRQIVRQEFGVLGPLRMRARCFKRYGIRRGRVVGRSIWALGCAIEAVFGAQRGQYDD